VSTPPPGPAQPRRRARVVSRAQPVIPSGRRPRHFKGQLADEHVIWILHRHPIYLLTPGWPVLIGIIALAAAHWWASFSPIPTLVAAAFALVMLGRWLAVDLPDWYARKYILTDRRAIATENFYMPQRREAVLTTVVQVDVDRPSPWLMLLNIGDVHVRVVGSSVDMTGVHRPRAVADSVLLTQQAARRATPKNTPDDEEHPNRLNRLADRLNEIAEEEGATPPPSFTPAPFGGFLARKIQINFMPGESVIDVIYRHWFVLIKRLLLPVGVGAGLVAIGLLVSFIGFPFTGAIGGPLVIVGAAIGLIWSLLVYLNYIDDVFVLTTHRLIDIDRVVFLLSEYSNDAPYNRVQNIHVDMGFIGGILGFGTIVVETAGRQHPLDMVGVPNPMQLMDRIFAMISAAKEREQRAESQRQRRDQLRMIAQAFGELLVSVPDVRGQTLLQAISSAQSAGLRLVVAEERTVHQGPLGVVLDQVPFPGSTALPDGELRIVLSTQAAQPSRTRAP